ncbi:hypothetical protein SAMN05421509_10361 [Chromohalobacter canadensis]|uniref:DUF4124 domain-containing protein n=1 Tax=Chromohalobacter canadensis TaxID=141389 RepID=A0A285VN52_9GAMM|nr:hypothetical protein SAMN05421509_10361 [Chromohalobacter canadensis]
MLALAAFVLPPPVQADVYKCVIDVTTAYQRTPCGESEPINTNTVTIMGCCRGQDSSSLNPVIRLRQHWVRTFTDAINDIPAMKESRARQERLDRAVVAGQITAGMSEVEARLVYGNPFRVDLDVTCRRLIWRRPDHAAGVCMSRVSSAPYCSTHLDDRQLLPPRRIAWRAKRAAQVPGCVLAPAAQLDGARPQLTV